MQPAAQALSSPVHAVLSVRHIAPILPHGGLQTHSVKGRPGLVERTGLCPRAFLLSREKCLPSYSTRGTFSPQVLKRGEGRRGPSLAPPACGLAKGGAVLRWRFRLVGWRRAARSFAGASGLWAGEGRRGPSLALPACGLAKGGAVLAGASGLWAGEGRRGPSLRSGLWAGEGRRGPSLALPACGLAKGGAVLRWRFRLVGWRRAARSFAGASGLWAGEVCTIIWTGRAATRR